LKSYLRASKASGTTRRRVEEIVREGERRTRRQFMAIDRRTLLNGNNPHSGVRLMYGEGGAFNE